MESCQCVHCTGDNFHLEQMAKEIADKDSYMENKSPSVYDKLARLYDATEFKSETEEIMGAINAIDNELISLALELPTEQAEKLLDIQMRLY